MREWLAEARSKKGYTMRQMGELLNISESYYSMIEKCERQKKMDITLVAKLSSILDVPLSKIVGCEERGTA